MLLPLLRTRPILSAGELRAAGIQPRDVITAADRGEIVRPFPGVVVRPDVYADPDYDDAEACYRTGGVIGHLSAAMRYGLCEALPASVGDAHSGHGRSSLSESPSRMLPTTVQSITPDSSKVLIGGASVSFDLDPWTIA